MQVLRTTQSRHSDAPPSGTRRSFFQLHSFPDPIKPSAKPATASSGPPRLTQQRSLNISPTTSSAFVPMTVGTRSLPSIPSLPSISSLGSIPSLNAVAAPLSIPNIPPNIGLQPLPHIPSLPSIPSMPSVPSFPSLQSMNQGNTATTPSVAGTAGGGLRRSHSVHSLQSLGALPRPHSVTSNLSSLGGPAAASPRPVDSIGPPIHLPPTPHANTPTAGGMSHQLSNQQVLGLIDAAMIRTLRITDDLASKQRLQQNRRPLPAAAITPRAVSPPSTGFVALSVGTRSLPTTMTPAGRPMATVPIAPNLPDIRNIPEVPHYAECARNAAPNFSNFSKFQFADYGQHREHRQCPQRDAERGERSRNRRHSIGHHAEYRPNALSGPNGQSQSVHGVHNAQQLRAQRMMAEQLQSAHCGQNSTADGDEKAEETKNPWFNEEIGAIVKLHRKTIRKYHRSKTKKTELKVLCKELEKKKRKLIKAAKQRHSQRMALLKQQRQRDQNQLALAAEGQLAADALPAPLQKENGNRAANAVNGSPSLAALARNSQHLRGGPMHRGAVQSNGGGGDDDEKREEGNGNAFIPKTHIENVREIDASLIPNVDIPQIFKTASKQIYQICDTYL